MRNDQPCGRSAPSGAPPAQAMQSHRTRVQMPTRSGTVQAAGATATRTGPDPSRRRPVRTGRTGTPLRGAEANERRKAAWVCVQGLDGEPLGMCHPALARMWKKKKKTRLKRIAPLVVRLALSRTPRRASCAIEAPGTTCASASTPVRRRVDSPSPSTTGSCGAPTSTTAPTASARGSSSARRRARTDAVAANARRAARASPPGGTTARAPTAGCRPPSSTACVASCGGSTPSPPTPVPVQHDSPSSSRSAPSTPTRSCTPTSRGATTNAGRCGRPTSGAS